MISKWTTHLPSEEREEFARTIRSAKPVLDRLKTIVEEKENSMEIQELSLTAYDNPNWSHKQAHQNGFKQCLSSFKQLINLDLQRETYNDPRTKLIQASGPNTSA